MIHSGGILGRLLDPLLKTGLPLIKNVIKPLAKSVLIPLGLTGAASAVDAGIHKKILGSGNTTLIISKDEINDIIKIIKSLEDSDLLLKGATETFQNEVKEQKGRFLSMLLGTLGAYLLGNLLTGIGAMAKSVSEEMKSTSQGRGIYRAGKGKGKGVLRANCKSWFWEQNGFLIPPHPLTNFEIQKYYKNQSRLNGVYSRDNLPKIKDGAYIINLDEFSDIGTHRVALWLNNNNVTYFDSFGVEHIPKGI